MRCLCDVLESGTTIDEVRELMDKTLATICTATICFSVSAALADEVDSKCTAWAQSAGMDEAICDCVSSALEQDDELRREYLDISSEADAEAASDELKEALSACG